MRVGARACVCVCVCVSMFEIFGVEMKLGFVTWRNVDTHCGHVFCNMFWKNWTLQIFEYTCSIKVIVWCDAHDIAVSLASDAVWVEELAVFI